MIHPPLLPFLLLIFFSFPIPLFPLLLLPHIDVLVNLEHQTKDRSSDVERLQKEIEELKKEISNRPANDPTNQKELDVVNPPLFLLFF